MVKLFVLYMYSTVVPGLNNVLVAFCPFARSFADEDVTLEVDPVALGKLEHGVELCFGDAAKVAVLEVGEDARIGTTA